MTAEVSAGTAPQGRPRHECGGEGVSPVPAAGNKWIGRSVTRLEDPPLVRGRGRFAADISFAHQLHMRIVRAHHAHGKIVSIDTSAARALPGVRCGVDRSRYCGGAADRFPRGTNSRVRALSAAGAGDRAGAIRRRAGRRGVRRRSLPGRGRGGSRLVRRRGDAGPARRRRRARRILARPQHGSVRDPPGLWRRRRGPALRARLSSSSN